MEIVSVDVMHRRCIIHYASDEEFKAHKSAEPFNQVYKGNYCLKALRMISHCREYTADNKPIVSSAYSFEEIDTLDMDMVLVSEVNFDI